jgi:7,8-dihydroneopterin aldolase/epimerase/oxygenase
MDRIFLRELKLQAVIGIFEWERRIRQTVSLDLEMAIDARRAAATDSTDNALNYKDVAKRVIGFVEASQFRMVETLAEAIAGIVIEEFDVPWVKVTVTKPGAIEGSRAVGVEIERSAAADG